METVLVPKDKLAKFHKADIMSDLFMAEQEDSINEHDDFEEDEDVSPSSSDNEDGNRNEDDFSEKDSFPKQTDEARRLAKPDSRWSKVERELFLVPKVVKRLPTTQDSVMSDVTGTTELDGMHTYQSVRGISNNNNANEIINFPSGQGHDSHADAAAKKEKNVTATRIMTYFADGSYAEKFQFSDGTVTTVTHSSNSQRDVAASNGVSKPRSKCNVYDDRIVKASLATSSLKEQEEPFEKQSAVIDAVCVRACDVDPQARIDALGMDPNGFVPPGAQTATLMRGEPDQRCQTTLGSRASNFHTALSDSSHRVETVHANVSRGDAASSTKTVSSTTSSTTESSQQMRVKRTTIKRIIKEPKGHRGSTHSARLPADEVCNRGAVRKCTTYSADGSYTERTVNADGTTTIIKRSIKNKNDTEATESLFGLTPTNPSTTSTASSTASHRPRPATKHIHPPTVGNSIGKQRDATKRIVKSRTTTSSSDGSRTEVTEYSDGSKVTKTIIVVSKEKTRFNNHR